MINGRIAHIFERENGTNCVRWYVSVNKETGLPSLTEADLVRFPANTSVVCDKIYEKCSFEAAMLQSINA